MRRPELLIIPVLMLIDYFLTLVGASMAAQKYRLHFKIAAYELNPIWRKSVEQRRWLNPRHLAMVALVTILLLLVDAQGDAFGAALPIAAGMLLGAFGAIVGLHISNLFIFRYLSAHPTEISGEVTMAHTFALKTSQSYYSIVLLPLLLLSAFTWHPYVIGACVGVLFLMGSHELWWRRARRSKPPQH